MLAVDVASCQEPHELGVLNAIAPENLAKAAPRCALHRLLERRLKFRLRADACTRTSTRVDAPGYVRSGRIDNKHAQTAFASRALDDAIDVLIAKPVADHNQACSASREAFELLHVPSRPCKIRLQAAHRA